MRLRVLGHGWAQPVVRKRSALWCSFLERLARLSGNRILAARKHRAWERACGIRSLA